MEVTTKQITKKEIRAKVKERFKDDEIIFQPKMKNLKFGQTIIDTKGRIGTVTLFDPTGRVMFNSAERFHALCAKFDDSNYDDCLRWSEVYCLVNVKENPVVEN